MVGHLIEVLLGLKVTFLKPYLQIVFTYCKRVFYFKKIFQNYFCYNKEALCKQRKIC